MARDTVEATLEQVRDVRAASRTHTQGPPPFYPAPPDDFGHGDGHGDDEGRPAPPLSNARLAMLMLLGTETMFFAGLMHDLGPVGHQGKRFRHRFVQRLGSQAAAHHEHLEWPATARKTAFR